MYNVHHFSSWQLTAFLLSIKPNLEEGEESRYSVGNVQCLLVRYPPLAPRQQQHRRQPCVAHASPQNGQSRGSGTLTCGSARLYWICSSDASQSLSEDWPTIIMSVLTRRLSFYRVFCSIRVAFDCPVQAYAVSREASCPCIVCHLDTKCDPLHLQSAPAFTPRYSYEHREGQDSGDESAAGDPVTK